MRFLAGMIVGAGLMYILDPRAGRLGRIALRDRYVSVGRSGSPQDPRRRHEAIDDRTVEARVRSELSRLASNPATIHVEVHDRRVSLTGSVPGAEMLPLVSAVSSLPGVQHVDNHLVAESADAAA